MQLLFRVGWRHYKYIVEGQKITTPQTATTPQTTHSMYAAGDSIIAEYCTDYESTTTTSYILLLGLTENETEESVCCLFWLAETES